MSGPILKSRKEIEEMRPANALTAQALKLVEEMVAPGITTAELDKAVERLIRKGGGTPSFLGYPAFKAGAINFPASICASINEEVVHGIPSDRTLNEGDIISVDIGVELNGWYGDAARTFGVGSISRKAQKLLDVTKQSLEKGIATLKPGVELNRLSAAIQDVAEGNGFSMVKDFVGHGIGRKMHEPPQIPNYVSRFFGAGSLRLKAGSVLAIEPMVNVGKSDVLTLADGWTVITKDRSLSAHFENSVAITEDGVIVLTEY
ncbi:MAG: type I methionyl aminopeptidase [Planctomycetes bacterium]|nr:type I methionyl aminopeptidase [Planctomycetota bacterium]